MISMVTSPAFKDSGKQSWKWKWKKKISCPSDHHHCRVQIALAGSKWTETHLDCHVSRWLATCARQSSTQYPGPMPAISILQLGVRKSHKSSPSGPLRGKFSYLFASHGTHLHNLGVSEFPSRPPPHWCTPRNAAKNWPFFKTLNLTDEAEFASRSSSWSSRTKHSCNGLEFSLGDVEIGSLVVWTRIRHEFWVIAVAHCWVIERINWVAEFVASWCVGSLHPHAHEAPFWISSFNVVSPVGVVILREFGCEFVAWIYVLLLVIIVVSEAEWSNCFPNWLRLGVRELGLGFKISSRWTRSTSSSSS